MIYEQFEKLLSTYRSGQEILTELYEMGFDFAEGKYQLVETLHDLLNAALSTHYNEEGVEWVYWYIYETDWQTKEGYEAYDDERKLIAQDLKGLWELLEQDYKLN